MYPLLFELGEFQVFTYPLMVGVAWGVAYVMCLSSDMIMEQGSFRGLFWGTFLFSWIGAKFFFLSTNERYSFEHYLTTWDFWQGGGFVFYGGFIFGLCYILIYSLVLKEFPANRLAWLLPPLGIGHALGRVGCFLSGCCYGVACDLPWAVHLHGQYRHPVPLYEALLLLFLSLGSYKLLRDSIYSWNVMGFYFVAYACGRFILEFFRGDQLRGVYAWGYSFSQLVSIGLMALGLLLLLSKRKSYFS